MKNDNSALRPPQPPPSGQRPRALHPPPEQSGAFFITCGWRFHDNVGVSETLLQRVITLVERAIEVRKQAAAPCSEFAVGASLDLGRGNVVCGANFEYGAGYRRAENRGVHAEVSALCAAVNRYGSDFEVEMVAIVASAEHPMSSGDSLDALRMFASPKTLLVSASLSKSVQISRLDDLFPFSFAPVQRDRLPLELQQLLARAEAARGRSSQVHSRDMIGLTGAAVQSDRGEIYEGSREDSVVFNPVSAIQAALSHGRAHGDPFVSAIAFASRTGDISGADRQRICEKAYRLERLDTIQVYMINERGEVRGATPRQLLPRAFLAKMTGRV